MTIIDYYLSEQEKQVKRFNETTLLFMQVGHFFEAYAVDNKTEKNNADNVYRVADILNIRHQQNICKFRELIMIGVNLFPPKHTGILTLDTPCINEQNGDALNVTREITKVYRRYIHASYTGSVNSNYLHLPETVPR